MKLVLLIFLVSQLSQDFLRKVARRDLNGDGIEENIRLVYADQEGNFTINIGSIEYSNKLSDSVDGFILVDVNENDKFLEVAIHTPGPSDDDEYLILRYKGNEIKVLGKLTRWPYFMRNGIVYVDDWMGFWKKREKFVLNPKTEQLEKVPQEFYYVGIEATVAKSFPIYQTRENKEVVANLKEKSKILIILCDPSDSNTFKHQYLIKSESGILGWASLESFEDKLEGLPWAD